MQPIARPVRRSLAALGALALFAGLAAAQARLPAPWASPRAEFMQRIGLTDVTVNAGRPAVKGRTIWGDLVPWGEVWRAGANENTTIRVADDVLVEGQPLPAGLYGLHMIPTQDRWTVIFSRNNASWGSFSYDRSEDALRVEVTPEASPMQEWLRYDFDDLSATGATLRLRWEKLAVPVHITVDTTKVVLDNARNDYLRGIARFSWQGWNNAANYCLQNKVNLEEALQWSQRSIGMGENYTNVSVYARLLDANGRADEARTARERAQGLATEAELNAAGYQLLQGGGAGVAAALELFQTNVEQHPDSWNAWDSLAEGLAAQGDKAKAAEMYSRALELAPADQHARIEAALKALGTP